VVTDGPDRQHRLAGLDAERLEVEAEFRQARGVVDILHAGRELASAS